MSNIRNRKRRTTYSIEHHRRGKLRIEVTGVDRHADGKWVKRAGRLTLKGEKRKEKGKLLIVLTGDETIRELNKRFLGRDYATDVLSFVYGDYDLYGETVISVDRAEAQAAEYGVSYNEELGRLIIHGILHLLGYTDESPADKERMRMKEDHYLTKLRGRKRDGGRMDQ